MKRSSLLNTMASFVGIAESPDGSNRTPIGEEFGWNGVAWCAETVSVACNRNGFPLHEAAVINVEAHARAGDWGMGWTRTPTVGSAVCFDFGGRGRPGDMHTGIVTEVLDGGRFRTIEGNYQNRCQRVLRDMKYVRGFATFPFEPESAPTSQNGSTGGKVVNGANRAQGGYALVGPDGGVFCEDGAPFFGSLPGIGVKPNAPIVSLAWTLTGNGYWLMASDGGVFSFGDAPFYGSYPGEPASVRNDPNRRFVAIVARSDGGYTEVSATQEKYDYV